MSLSLSLYCLYTMEKVAYYIPGNFFSFLFNGDFFSLIFIVGNLSHSYFDLDPGQRLNFLAIF